MAFFKAACDREPRLASGCALDTSVRYNQINDFISDWCFHLERTVESMSLRDRIFNEITPGLKELRLLFKSLKDESDMGHIPTDETILRVVKRASDLYFAYFKPTLRRDTCLALDPAALRLADKAINCVRQFLEGWCIDGPDVWYEISYKSLGPQGRVVRDQLPYGGEEFDDLMMKILKRGRNIRIEALREEEVLGQNDPASSIIGTLISGNK
jgi:hypothetical protein